MGSSYLNVPTFCSGNNNTFDGDDNGNWTLLNQVYEKIAENEEEQKNKVEETNKHEYNNKESYSKKCYQQNLQSTFNKNVTIPDTKNNNIQQNKRKSIENNIVIAYQTYNDLSNLDITNNLLDCQHTKKNSYHNFNCTIDNKSLGEQSLSIKTLSNSNVKNKIQHPIIKFGSNLKSSPSTFKLLVKNKHDNITQKNKYNEENLTCARLQPYNNFKKKVENNSIISIGLKNNRDLISFPELPNSSIKHKRKITNSDILDPQVHGHAISKKAMVETSAYSRYQIMVSEWRHYVKMVKSKVHGFGLVANVDIPENTYIIEYTGEQIRYEIANIREKKYIENGLGVYFFQIDNDYVVDATFYGSCSRYMNHSCEANCIAHIIYINEKKKIIMISSRDIRKGEELVYDYKFEREEGSKNRIPCYCGAKKCKKWIN
ncbi:Histone-lysine N-methyltransferase 2D [Strongyloides ratti]|uniref:Histone-lysine N-methyltransferase 2D n=1 Tax=Strongyloides ratti TaxID=34506 RepID=A0A090MVW6_STRRB|nr:Histone-lysine N-methyltransferase 2D [Strongyloides ratti]CEF63173.1 Histone-lysine N-methyltransferase 2D [Strongyloides ratti]